MLKNEKMRFVIKVAVAHIATYIICGIFFSQIFNYEENWQAGVFGSQMRDYNSIIIFFGPFFQIIRGLLFGGILLLIPRDFFSQKLSWLKLWAVIAGIGIINTPGPGLGSIEGVIYTVVPLKAYVGCVEIFVQTLWFSWLVCRQKSDNGFFKKYKYPLIAAVISLFGISISGILIALIKQVDPMTGAQDPYAILILLFSALTAFAVAVWYVKKPSGRIFIFLAVSFLANGIYPMIYNYVTSSVYQSLLPVLMSLILTFLSWLFICRKNKE